MTFKLEVDLSAFEMQLDEKEDLVLSGARPAAQAMAQVLYDEVNSNVAKLGTKSGNLASAIYQVFSKDESSPGVATYHVSWNARKAPHGHLVEFGHIQRFKVYFKGGKWYTAKNAPLDAPRHVAANPFVRPAISKFPQAQAAGEEAFYRHIGLIA